jgi:DNA-binding beta-propeller fold protein YncE
MKQHITSRVLRSLCQTLGILLLTACATSTTQAPKMQDIPVFPPAPDEARFFFERTLYTSADVSLEDKETSLRQKLLGESQVGEGLSKPYGVAVYHGRVYVSDTGSQSVAVFDIPGQRFFKLDTEGEGQLRSPLGLDIDGKGQVYVVDGRIKAVKVFDTEGKYLRTLAADGEWFARPTGIAVDAEGKRIYVVDTGGVETDKHHVQVFDAQTGEHLFKFSKRGSAPGELNLPRDITIGNDGLLYVVDGGNFRVQVFRPDGTFVRVFGGIGRQGGQFSRPKEISADADGNVYIVDTAFGNFQIFNPEGQLLLSVGGRAEKDGMAKYMLPSGIAIDGDGRVYMVDQFFRKVDVYRPAKLAADQGFTLKVAKPAK